MFLSHEIFFRVSCETLLSIYSQCYQVDALLHAVVKVILIIAELHQNGAWSSSKTRSYEEVLHMVGNCVYLCGVGQW